MATPSSAPFPLTGNEIYDLSLTGFRWELGPDRTIWWSISDGFGGEEWGEENASLAAVAFQRLFEAFASYIDVRFRYAGYFSDPVKAYDGGSDINISFDANQKFFDNPNFWGIGFFPADEFNQIYRGAPGDIFINLLTPANFFTSWEPGSAGWLLLIHEIGHALGLKHTHDDGGTGRPTAAEVGAAILDIDWFSIMSYKDDFQFNLNYWDPATPMPLDVLGLQYLYGKNQKQGYGDDIYDLERLDLYVTIWDPAGEDVLNASNSNYGWNIVLPQPIGEGVDQFWLGSASLFIDRFLLSQTTLYWLLGEFEHAIGSPYSDSITGNSLLNILATGSGGDDYLSGGAGDDVYVVTKSRGSTLIEDSEGSNALILSEQFIGENGVSKLNIHSTPDLSLHIENSFGGTIEIQEFFAAFGRPIETILIDDATFDVSSATSAEDVADIIGAVFQQDLPSDFIDGVNIGDAGDSLNDATQIEGNAVISGYASYELDEWDIFVFTAVFSGVVKLSLSGLSGDLDLGLYDSETNALARDSRRGSESESVSYDIVEGESYWVGVQAREPDASVYDLIIEFPEPQNLPPDFVNGSDIGDAGDFINRATEVFNTTYVEGFVSSEGDQWDLYKFTVEASGGGQLWLRGLSGDLGVAFYDDQGNRLADGFRSGTNNEIVNYSLIKGETYWVGVFAPDSVASQYRLTIALPEQQSFPSDFVNGVDIGDAGDFLTLETAIRGDTFVEGFASSDEDQWDLFAYSAEISGVARLWLRGLSDDLDVAFYDSDGILLADDTRAGQGEERASYAFEEGETFLIGVNARELASSVYELTIEFIEGTGATLIDDDESYWDATIVTADGTEISAAEAQLFRTYFGALGRRPDDIGYQWWLNEIEEGRHDLRSMARGFIFSEEFQDLADSDGSGSIQNDELLDHMYKNVFGREPDNDGYIWWWDQLNTGNRTQVDVVVEMTQSNEYVELTMNAVVDYLVG